MVDVARGSIVVSVKDGSGKFALVDTYEEATVSLKKKTPGSPGGSDVEAKAIHETTAKKDCKF